MTIKALSIRQPWASLIASGRKTLEVRRWSTSYRGPLLICASRSTEVSGDGREALLRFSLDDSTLPHGEAVCLVNLVGSRQMRPEDSGGACCRYEAGMNVLILQDPILVPAFAVMGRLHLFPVEPPQEVCERLTMLCAQLDARRVGEHIAL